MELTTLQTSVEDWFCLVLKAENITQVTKSRGQILNQTQQIMTQNCVHVGHQNHVIP